ncbi:MAG: C39 family peptidase [Candidatus Moranbacteria bacterium]|nr:C39 family peptidase [Candidatus Moranbacteria bacterium]
MGRKLLLILFVIVVVSGVAIRRFPTVFLHGGEEKPVKSGDIASQEPNTQPTIVSEKEVSADLKESAQGGSALGGSSLIENVPFTVQAPFGEWDVVTFQDGCEEAALVMVAHWLSGKPLTREIAKKEIMDLAGFEDKKYGQSIDTSAEDTQKLLMEYYGVTTSELRTDILMTDIQETLAIGAIVIVPADGRKLMNPNYKQPGPTTHMLVVIGYDAGKKEFIANDSGTRKGQGYRYKEDILYEAIRNYPTGDHLPIRGIHKDMIVVSKP